MVKTLIKAARLRTLPLAIAAIALGSVLAAFFQMFSWDVALLAMLTAVLLQILSNFANDYGDFSKGVDDDREDRVMSSGELSQNQMRTALLILGILSFGSGLILLYIALGGVSIKSIIYLILGLASIGAAIKYTAGKNPYGYRGLGDVMVFIFFGFVSVSGVYFLHNPEINRAFWLSLLPATSFGLLSVGVLNINNIRDIVNDKKMGKITLAASLGKKGAELYQLLLIIGAFICLWVFVQQTINNSRFSLFLLLPLYLFHWWLLKVLDAEPASRPSYNRLLKQMVLLNAILVLVIGLILLF
jgi:1,4-dihydroxy-2-naphthoate polyprenyltransferase